jgi:DnaJ family protein C protein 28
MIPREISEPYTPFREAGMGIFGKSADEIIQRAMQAGEFDNLPGKGKPLKLDENPHEPAEWRTAYNLLRSNGYSLPWLELRKEIEEALDRARQDASASWRSGDPVLWQKQQTTFTQRIATLNQRIFQYNLQTPSPIFHRLPLDAGRELEMIKDGDLNSSMQSKGR